MHSGITDEELTASEMKHPKPPFLWSLLALKCPRCRRGPVFKHKNPYKKLNLNYMLESYDDCVCCGQWYRIEPGIWFGTSYVSYVLMVIISAVSFGLWWLTIGWGPQNWKLISWLVINGLLLLALQPFMMRLSRIIFLSIFVKYDPLYDERPPRRIF